MKKSSIFLMSLLFLATVGCDKEIEVMKVEKGSKIFTAITESYSPQTKTSRDSEGNVLWKAGDQLSIFAGSTINEQYQVSDDSDGSTSATLNNVGSTGFVAGSELPCNIAYYPYSASNAIALSGTGYELSVTLPSTQTYVLNSFGNGAFPMAAVSNSKEDMNLKFKNVLGGLKLQLKGTAKITRITFSGNNNEILCGAATVTVSNTTTPTITLSDVTKNQVTLDCASGVQLNSETATTFIIALPPMIMSGGFTIDLYDDENSTHQQIKSTRSQTITRSALLSMPEVSVVMTSLYTYVDLGLSVKWATCNVGASSPEEYGDYYAWGETEPYYEAGYAQEDPQAHWKEGKSGGYAFSSYKWCNGSYNTLTKYCNYGEFGNEGFTDTRTTLDPDDDVAHVKWGGSWRMPTKAEQDDLCTKCTWTWYSAGNTEFNGVAGYKVTSNVSGYTDHSIFLPATGWRDGTDLNEVGSSAYYWSSSLGTDYPDDQGSGSSLRFDSDYIFASSVGRFLGNSVRPVCP